VPHSPETDQVSSILIWSGENTTVRSWGPPPASSMQLPNSHWQSSQPLANAHRPLTRYPPSTATAVPEGAKTPPMMASGPSA
jgi:hypothetical protein